MAQKEEKKVNKFQLKKGVIIPIVGTSKVYSEFNITDEIAIKLIKENKNRLSLFAIVPADLKEVLEQPKTDNEEIDVNGVKYPLIDVIESLEVADLKTRATSVTGVLNFINKLNEKDLAKFLNVINPEPINEELTDNENKQPKTDNEEE